jgi:hypothetical protein
MNIALWIAQGILAFTFVVSGAMKSAWSRERLVKSGQTGVQNYSVPAIRAIAFCELLGAAGAVLPWWLGIAPVLTPIAALGLAGIMFFAARAHAELREPNNVSINMAIFALALFVAMGRAFAY